MTKPNKLNRPDLIDYVKELQLELKEMEERRDFWRKQFYKIRKTVDAHIEAARRFE